MFWINASVLIYRSTGLHCIVQSLTALDNLTKWNEILKWKVSLGVWTRHTSQKLWRWTAVRVRESAAQQHPRPSHQHLMKYLGSTPYFNGVRGRGVQGGGRVGGCVCVVKRCPLETVEGNGGLCISELIFLSPWKEERREKWRESKRERERQGDYSPLESGFWGTQAQESVNLAGLRGAGSRAGGPRRAD